MEKSNVLFWDFLIMVMSSSILFSQLGYISIPILIILNFFLSRYLIMSYFKSEYLIDDNFSQDDKFESKAINYYLTVFFFNNILIFAVGLTVGFFIVQAGFIILSAYLASMIFLILTLSLLLYPIFVALSFKKSEILKEPVSLASKINRLSNLLGFINILIIAGFLTIFFHESGHGFMYALLGVDWLYIAVNPFTFSGWAVGYSLEYNLITDSWVLLAGNLCTMLVGSVFLLSLLLPQIRKFKFSCFLNFIIGVFGIVSGLAQLGAHSIRYLSGVEYYADTTIFLNIQSHLGTGINAVQIIILTTPLIILTHLLLYVLGKKIWRIHFQDMRFFGKFILINELIFWGYFIYHLAF